MIQVREVFHIDPAGMKEAKSLLPEARGIMARLGMPAWRVLTDLTGDYYTLVIETQHPSLAEFEEGLRRGLTDPEWQAFYPKLRALIIGGRREIYDVVSDG